MEDDITLQIKLEWTQRRLEESEQLVASLRHSVNSVLSTLEDSQEKASILSMRQDALVAEKNAYEARLEELIKEKSELAAENASLRSCVKESSQKSALLMSADTLVMNMSRQQAGSQGGEETQLSDGSSLDRFRASRTLVARLLWIVHRAGLRLTDADLLGSDKRDMNPSTDTSNIEAQRTELAEALVTSFKLQEHVTQAVASRAHASLPAGPGEEGPSNDRLAAATSAVATLRGHAGHDVAHGQLMPSAEVGHTTGEHIPRLGVFGSIFSLLVGDDGGGGGASTRPDNDQAESGNVTGSPETHSHAHAHGTVSASGTGGQRPLLSMPVIEP